MYQLTKCCCCISIKTGAYIIGSLHVLGLVGGFLLLNPLQIAMEIFCGGAFLMMIYKDNLKNRLMYFSAYVVYLVILATIRMIFVFWNHDEKALVADYCENLNANLVLSENNKYGWSATDFKDV